VEIRRLQLFVGPSLIGRRQTIVFSLLVDGRSPHLSPPQQSLIDVAIRPVDPAHESSARAARSLIVISILGAALLTLIFFIIANSSNGSGPTAVERVQQEMQCDAQSKATEDIFVRLITPLQTPVAERLRATAWNATTQTCDSSMQMILSSAPSDAGHCTQVGYVAYNPGYNPNATPAAPLRKVVASAGPTC
jgi:hypothetical protein